MPFSLRRTSDVEDLELTRQHDAIALPRKGTIEWDAFDASAFDSQTLDAAARAWGTRAIQEFHSLALFTDLTAKIHLLGAPLDWSGAFARMVADEVRHTDLCLRMCDKLQRPVTPSIEESELHIGSKDTLRVHVRDVVVAAFCIGETISGIMFRRALRAATVPLARDVVSAIVVDETFHGELGWELAALLMRDIDERERDALRARVPHLVHHYAKLCGALPGRTWARSEPSDDPEPNFGTSDARRLRARVLRRNGRRRRARSRLDRNRRSGRRVRRARLGLAEMTMIRSPRTRRVIRGKTRRISNGMHVARTASAMKKIIPLVLVCFGCGARTSLSESVTNAPCPSTPPTCVQSASDPCGAPSVVAATCDASAHEWVCGAGARVYARAAESGAVCRPFHGASSIDSVGPWGLSAMTHVATDDGRCLWIADSAELADGTMARNVAFEPDPTAPFGTCPVESISPPTPIVTIEGGDDRSHLGANRRRLSTRRHDARPLRLFKSTRTPCSARRRWRRRREMGSIDEAHRDPVAAKTISMGSRSRSR